MDLSESTLVLIQQNEELMVQQQAFREIIQQLTKENATLREEKNALTVQNSIYLELLQQNQDKDQRSEGDEDSNGAAAFMVEDLQRTIEALQERVIGLVQEKLSMQTFIEELEHELAIVSAHTRSTVMSTKKELNKEPSNTPELALEDTESSQQECLETARRQQQEQLSLEDVNISGRQPSVDANSSNKPLFGEFDIKKELEEQLHKRTTVVRPSDGFVRSTSCPTSSLNPSGGIAASRFLRGGTSESSLPQIQEAKEGKEKQRSRLWITRVGFKGAQDVPPGVAKSVQRGLGTRRKTSDSVMMLECDDEVIERFNDRRESAFPDVPIHLSEDATNGNSTESITNLNLVL